jgi:hypothetical protein
MRSAPNPKPAEPPLRSGAENRGSQLVVLFFALDRGHVLGSDAAYRGAPSRARELAAPATLQLQHVRIQT